MLYIIYNTNSFDGIQWYILDSKSTDRIVEGYMKGVSPVKINGRTYDIFSHTFQIFLVPSEFENNVKRAEDWFITELNQKYKGNFSFDLFEDVCENVTKNFLQGREWGSLRSPLYNLLYKTQANEYLLLALEKDDVQDFVIAYHRGDQQVTVLGEDIMFSKPSNLSIFDIELKWYKESIGKTRKFLRGDRYNYNSKAPSFDILEIYGSEVTTEFNVKSYGSQKVEKTGYFKESKMPLLANSKKKIFISHSTVDKMVVKKFVDIILDNALGLDQKEIFCSSIEGLGIKSGEDFRERIKKEILDATISLQFLSENYKSSEVCQNEMGAVWVLCDRVIPLVLGEKYDGGFIHSTSQQIKIYKKRDLLQFIADYADLFPNMAGHAKIDSHVDEFLNWLGENGN